jgi:hypothetical protein
VVGAATKESTENGHQITQQITEGETHRQGSQGIVTPFPISILFAPWQVWSPQVPFASIWQTLPLLSPQEKIMLLSDETTGTTTVAAAQPIEASGLLVGYCGGLVYECSRGGLAPVSWLKQESCFRLPELLNDSAVAKEADLQTSIDLACCCCRCSSSSDAWATLQGKRLIITNEIKFATFGCIEESTGFRVLKSPHDNSTESITEPNVRLLLTRDELGCVFVAVVSTRSMSVGDRLVCAVPTACN